MNIQKIHITSYVFGVLCTNTHWCPRAILSATLSGQLTCSGKFILCLKINNLCVLNQNYEQFIIITILESNKNGVIIYHLISVKSHLTAWFGDLWHFKAGSPVMYLI